MGPGLARSLALLLGPPLETPKKAYLHPFPSPNLPVQPPTSAATNDAPLPALSLAELVRPRTPDRRRCSDGERRAVANQLTRSLAVVPSTAPDSTPTT